MVHRRQGSVAMAKCSVHVHGYLIFMTATLQRNFVSDQTEMAVQGRVDQLAIMHTQGIQTFYSLLCNKS